MRSAISAAWGRVPALGLTADATFSNAQTYWTAAKKYEAEAKKWRKLMWGATIFTKRRRNFEKKANLAAANAKEQMRLYRAAKKGVRKGVKAVKKDAKITKKTGHSRPTTTSKIVTPAEIDAYKAGEAEEETAPDTTTTTTAAASTPSPLVIGGVVAAILAAFAFALSKPKAAAAAPATYTAKRSTKPHAKRA